jgi:hypothetical protein
VGVGAGAVEGTGAVAGGVAAVELASAAVAPGEELVTGALGSSGRAALAAGSGMAEFVIGWSSGEEDIGPGGLLATDLGVARLPEPSGPRPPGSASTTGRNSWMRFLASCACAQFGSSRTTSL